MRTFPLIHTDSFTNVLFGGNPTATILDADSLSDEEMKKIAIEMNHSETGFQLKSKLGDLRLRYFTRGGDEIPFCGHATVGAMLAYAGGGATKKSYAVETNRGLLNIKVVLDTVEMELPEVSLEKAPITREEFEEALGAKILDHAHPLMLDKKINYLYGAAKSLDALKLLNPDFSRLEKFCRKYSLTIACLTVPETFDPEMGLHSRGFAPAVGVPEDPFTGSMQGGAYFFGKMAGWTGSKNRVGMEQGHIMGRPGMAFIEETDAHLGKTRLLGSGKRLFKTEITLL